MQVRGTEFQDLAWAAFLLIYLARIVMGKKRFCSGKFKCRYAWTLPMKLKPNIPTLDTFRVICSNLRLVELFLLCE